MKRSVQVVGRFESRLSIPTVCRELAAACVRARRFARVYAYSSDHVAVFPERCKYGLYNWMPSGVAIGLENDRRGIGMTFGHPFSANQWLGGYETRVAGLLCETSFVPPDWIANCHAMTALWAPSEWVASTYTAEGCHLPIKIFRHGIDPAFSPSPSAPVNERFTFLSVGLGLFQQRKGLLELVQAFGAAFPKADGPELLLLTTPTDELLDLAEKSGVDERVRIWEPPEEGLTPMQMAHLLRRVHFYVAPSKSEGYGLLPCEARACGTPVALTRQTGHLEHFREGVDVEIPVHGTEIISHDFRSRDDDRGELKGRVAAVPVDGLVETLRSCYADFDAHKRALAASIVAKPEPTWAQALEPFTDWLATLEGAQAGLYRW